ncbi:MAG: MOSC domain-containing protein [Sphingobium sp.]
MQNRRTAGPGALAQPVPMERFRPGLVVSGDGLEAWAETRWQQVRAGECLFDLVKPSARCIVITQDHRTGERPCGNAPIKALRTLGRFDRSGVLFGENAIPRRMGRIAVGDSLVVDEMR